jgi:hypothetical protein
VSLHAGGSTLPKLATQAEAEAGALALRRGWSPERIAQAIQALAQGTAIALVGYDVGDVSELPDGRTATVTVPADTLGSDGDSLLALFAIARNDNEVLTCSWGASNFFVGNVASTYQTGLLHVLRTGASAQRLATLGADLTGISPLYTVGTEDLSGAVDLSVGWDGSGSGNNVVQMLTVWKLSA